MTSSFKPGDTVALKSGGHPMTVFDIGKDGVSASWFDEAGKYENDEFFFAEVAHIIRKAVHLDEVTIRHIWVFAETGEPIADHIAYCAPAPETS